MIFDGLENIYAPSFLGNEVVLNATKPKPNCLTDRPAPDTADGQASAAERGGEGTVD